MTTDIRRPSAEGDRASAANGVAISYSSGTEGWPLVNEEVLDESTWTRMDITAIPGDAFTGMFGWHRFIFPKFTIHSNSVVSKVRTRLTYRTDNDEYMFPGIKINGAGFYDADEYAIESINGLYTMVAGYPKNPVTDAAWAAADVNGIGPVPLQQFGLFMYVEEGQSKYVTLYQASIEVLHNPPESEWVPPVIWL